MPKIISSIKPQVSDPSQILKKSQRLFNGLLMGVLLICLMSGTTQIAQASRAMQSASFERIIQSTALADPSADQEPVTLTAPEDNLITTGENTPPLGVPRMQWEPTANADRYRIQLSTAFSFAEPIISEITYMNSYTPQKVLIDGDYYWRVQAQVDNIWWPYSAVRTFTKDWTNNGRILPELQTPVNESEFATFEADNFTWTPVVGAALYRFEISSDENFSSIAYDAESLKTHHTPIERLPNNLYFWRVTPVDNGDNIGVPSNTFSFRFQWDFAPDLIGPADDTDQAFLPQFSWTAVEAADTYLLQLSTDPDFNAPQQFAVHQTTYTPEKGLANDQEYYWRVQALDTVGNSGKWSEIRRFRMRWNFQTELLSPENSQTFVSYPVLQWSPIPGAERYQVQVDESTSFDRPFADLETYNVSANSLTLAQDIEIVYGGDLFWRVRGIDAQDNYTPWSRTSSYRLEPIFGPNLIYPRYYYAPDSENLPQFLDKSVGWPLFMWDAANMLVDLDKPRTFSPDYYELAVASDPAYLDIRFQLKTAGQAAVPTVDNPFTNLVSGELYYWRVRGYIDGIQVGVDTSWVARFDTGIQAQATTDELTILYPADRFEAVDGPPVLGWKPVISASHYRVQISRGETFAGPDILEEAQPTVPNYSPWQGREVDDIYQAMPIGIYWWRVQAEDAQGSAIGTWSTPRRFHISHNIVNGNVFDLTPPLYPSSILSETASFDPALALVGTNPLPASDQYLIDNLHVMLNRVDLREPTLPDNYNWIISFEVTKSVTGPVLYGLYIDVNHLAGGGATVDPLRKPIEVDPLILPEYAIYVTRTGNSFAPSDVQFYRWSGANWAPARSLAAIGGEIWYDEQKSAIQLLLPYTSIGAGDIDFAGSMAMAAFSTSSSSQDGLLDSVPPQGSVVDNPTLMSDIPTPLIPFDAPFVDALGHLQVPTFYWRTESYDSIDGYQVQVARDAEFTDVVETAEVYEKQMATPYSWLPAAFQSLNAYEDNESYYWRVRARHERYESDRTRFDYSPWSMPMRFTLDSQSVGNPSLSTSSEANTTPTFSWERLEGVSGYTIQVDTSADFSRPVINTKVDGTSFTPSAALADDTYYWRVAMRRSDKVLARWTETMTFTKRAETPLLVSPIDGLLLDEQPTFVWDPIIMPSPDAKIATPRYQLQVSNSADFSGTGFNAPKALKTDSTSYTLSERDSLADGTWYWRVAALDAKGQVGAYSPTESLIKQYPGPLLVTALGQSFAPGTINFAWEPVEGAANYELQYDDNQFFDSPRRITTDNTQFSPIDNLMPGIYYWRVKMLDADRNEGTYSNGEINVTWNKIFLPMLVE